MVEPFVDTTGIRYDVRLADDGDFYYEPQFFEVVCWENTLEDVRKEMQDIPPILDDFGILECHVCASSIRQEELLGLITFGELQCSRRTPEGTPTTFFQSFNREPTVLCISCIRKLNDHHVELWDDVAEDEECEEGTHFRCWRHGCQAGLCQLRLIR